MNRYLREPVSGLTHLTAMFLSVSGLTLLITAAAQQGTGWHVFSFAVFGVSLTLMYASSALYHLLPLDAEGVRALRRLDHMMIFVLIGGSYTPFCLVPLRDSGGWTLFTAIWGLAAAGFGFKLLWMDAPRVLSTSIYVAMGLLCLFAFGPLVASVPPAGMFWLAAGGLVYIVGAVVYATKWPDPYPGVFGFHEIWHLFVIAGSACHFWAVFRYVLQVP